MKIKAKCYVFCKTRELLGPSFHSALYLSSTVTSYHQVVGCFPQGLSQVKISRNCTFRQTKRRLHFRNVSSSPVLILSEWLQWPTSLARSAAVTPRPANSSVLLHKPVSETLEHLQHYRTRPCSSQEQHRWLDTWHHTPTTAGPEATVFNAAGQDTDSRPAARRPCECYTGLEGVNLWDSETIKWFN